MNDLILADVKELIKKNNEVINLLTNEIEILKPKAEAFNDFMNAEKWYSSREIAQMLKININGEIKGRNTLIILLQEIKFLSQNKLPYQNYVNNGYCKVVTTIKKDSFNQSHAFATVYYSNKGFDFIYRKLKELGYVKSND